MHLWYKYVNWICISVRRTEVFNIHCYVTKNSSLTFKTSQGHLWQDIWKLFESSYESSRCTCSMNIKAMSWYLPAILELHCVTKIALWPSKLGQGHRWQQTIKIFTRYTCGMNIKTIFEFLPEILELQCITKNSPVTLKTKVKVILDRVHQRPLLDAPVVWIWRPYSNFCPRYWNYIAVLKVAMWPSKLGQGHP